MHEWAIMIVPRDFDNDYNKYKVKRVKQEIKDSVDLGSNPSIELVDLIAQVQEVNRLKKKISALERKLNE